MRLATILLYRDADYWSEQGEAIRQAINTSICPYTETDGVIDLTPYR